MNDNDQPVFDTGKKDRPIEFEIGVDIPAGKVAARAELERLIAEQMPIIIYGKTRKPRGPVKWKPKKYVAANDNEPAPPIFEALRRDGRESDIPLIMRYRVLVEVVGTTAYDDKIDLNDEGMNVENRSLRMSGDRFEKDFARMTATSLPGGEISYREQRHTAKQIANSGTRTNQSDTETGIRTQTPLRLVKSEDEAIARIDGEPILAALRAGMGDLAVFFEDAVLGRPTFTELGERLGYKWKARSREAKILLYTAIDRLRDQWRMIERQMAATEAACERRVKDRRAELAAARAAYLGLAA